MMRITFGTPNSIKYQHRIFGYSNIMNTDNIGAIPNGLCHTGNRASQSIINLFTSESANKRFTGTTN